MNDGTEIQSIIDQSTVGAILSELKDNISAEQYAVVLRLEAASWRIGYDAAIQAYKLGRAHGAQIASVSITSLEQEMRHVKK